VIEVRAGEIFNSWTVIRHAKGARSIAQVLCSCGAVGSVMVSTLRHGGSRQCRACGQRRRRDREETTSPTDWLRADAGDRFGAFRLLHKARGARTRVRVICECGAVTSRKLEHVVKRRLKCYQCEPSPRLQKMVIFEGKRISLVRFMRHVGAVTIHASAIDVAGDIHSQVGGVFGR
jgi:hypothetical protein